MKNKHIGSSFDGFLEEHGILASSQAEAIKRVISWQIQQHLESTQMKKSTFAKKLGTSRSQLDRLLDPANTSLNIKTLTTAAEVMGKRLELQLV